MDQEKTKEDKIKVTAFKKVTDFLNAYLCHAKSINPTWTVSEWARDLRLEATGSLTKILNGQRNIGPVTEKAFASYFNFSPKELRHFQMLIRNDKTESDDPIKRFITDEIDVIANTKPHVVLSEEEWKQIHTWHYITLRQLSKIIPLPKDNTFLNKLLNTSEEINLVQVIEILASKGFLTEVNGKFIASDVNLTTQNNISSESIKSYHEQMGQLALQAIRKYEIQKRDIQSCTLAFDQKNFSKAQDLVEKFINDFDSLLDSSSGDSVYQLNVQFFPLAVCNEISTT